MRLWTTVILAMLGITLIVGVLGNFSAVAAASEMPSEVRRPRPLTLAETTPITNPQPPSTLLPHGTSSITLSVETPVNTICAYAVDGNPPYEQMTRFAQSNQSKTHVGTVAIDPDSTYVNQVYVRCASDPTYSLRLLYRSLPEVNPSYPRTGNLWGGQNFADKTITETARIDLWLGPDFDSDKIRQLRQINPEILILTSINAVEEWNLPDDFYLKDINGKKVEIWPNFYRLNLTKPYVAEYQARSAAKRIIDSGLLVDGIFFDNVFTSQSWLSEDIYGNPFPIDADENGKADLPWELDAKWKQGIFAELQLFRQLMPHAIINGHAMNINERGIGEIFNGISIGFEVPNVLEGERSFASLLSDYQKWEQEAVKPNAIMFEASPPDLLAYGYSYDPWDDIPPATLEFARTYYPYMRFGLIFTLMGDGYFAYEFGDAWHGNDWWYDELDFDLGHPKGAAQRLNQFLGESSVNLLANGDFEQPFDGNWDLWANGEEGASAQLSSDTSEVASGVASARIDIQSISGTDWHVEMRQWGLELSAGATYLLKFSAKADKEREITLQSRKGSPDWDLFGLDHQFPIDSSWRSYSYTFEANTNSAEARLQFQVGEMTGTVWLDDVQLYETSPSVYRRDFDNGIVLLNGSSQPVTVDVEEGYQRLLGSQAPRHEWMIDNESVDFTSIGNASITTFDSGEWHATPPFYHNWGKSTHLLDPGSVAQWSLNIEESDRYSITVWYPAAPAAINWNPAAMYEVVVDDEVVASKILNQRSNGDQWQIIGEVALAPNDTAFVRLRCEGNAVCAADAIYAQSAARYNDGSSVKSVTLQPLDSIILQKQKYTVNLPIVTKD